MYAIIDIIGLLIAALLLAVPFLGPIAFIILFHLGERDNRY